MKRKYYILGFLATLCLLGTSYYAWTLYDAHRKQVAEWSEGAKAAFEEALWMEVDKRAEVPFTHSSNGREGMTTFKEKIPDTVFITSHLGRIGYLIEHSRYENSLIKERKKRAKQKINCMNNCKNMHYLSLSCIYFLEICTIWCN